MDSLRSFPVLVSNYLFSLEFFTFLVEFRDYVFLGVFLSNSHISSGIIVRSSGVSFLKKFS